jgi:hypothetical protein
MCHPHKEAIVWALGELVRNDIKILGNRERS